MTTLRIFISSPGDVAEEREKARLVIDQLQRNYGSRVKLLPVFWEDLPLQPDASFQTGIELVLSAEHGIDIAIFILWSRLGSPVGGANRKPDGSPFLSGTERELFLMLEARKQSGDVRPQMLVYTREDHAAFQKRLNPQNSDELLDIVEQRLLVEKFIREHFRDEEGRNRRAYHSYDRPLTFAERLRVHLRAMIDAILGAASINGTVWEHDPYRGLRVFDLEHAPIFFGREREICALQELLRQRAATGCAFAVVVGASGSGKSSLARAGVAAALVRDNLDSTVAQWRLAVMRPSAVQGGPFAALLNALTDKAEALPELLDSEINKSSICSAFERDAGLTTQLSILPAIARATDLAGGQVRLLLILDQLEELWTDRGVTLEMRERFLAAIEAFARCGAVWVLATLRTDCYSLAQLSETFLRLKGADGQYDLVAPGPAALQRIIVEPARMAGLHFEHHGDAAQSLDHVILRDAIGQPDALPLLEFALDQLFRETGTQRQLTFAAYEKMGGVEGALGQKAEAEFIKLPPEVQLVFGDVMNTLVTVDAAAGAHALRRTAPLACVLNTDSEKALINTFVDLRLLTADNEGGEAVVRVAHEALLRCWQRLAHWIAANRDYLRLRARVEHSHARWRQAGRDNSLLLPPGLPLEEGNTLLRESPGLLTDDTKAYIRQSSQHQEMSLTRSRRVRRTVTSALATLLMLALAFGAVAWKNRRELQSAYFRSTLQNAEADDKGGESAKIIAALQPFLADRELNQEMRDTAQQLVNKACDGFTRMAEFEKQVRRREPEVNLKLGEVDKKPVMLTMVRIPSGTFMMGSPDSEVVFKDPKDPASAKREEMRKKTEKQHEVKITKAFYMGIYHVTQLQFKTVMGSNPSFFQGKTESDSHPVDFITWNDADKLCKKLQRQSGDLQLQFDLPTEAQWEYACRAGTTARYYFGESSSELGQYAWFDGNAGERKGEIGNAETGTHPVGTKQPNHWKLCDMHGNVYDWCRDWYDSGYYSTSAGRVAEDPAGPNKGEFIPWMHSEVRVLRGGSWGSDPEFCRSAARNSYPPYNGDYRFGFRIVLEPSSQPRK